MEDSKTPTVSNRLADMIIQFETHTHTNFESDVLMNDPEDEFFPEDEVIDNFEDEDANDDDEEEFNIKMDSLNDIDVEKFHQLLDIKTDLKKFKHVNLLELCKCSLSNIGGIIFEIFQNLKKLNPDDDVLKQMTTALKNKVTPFVDQVRQHLKEKNDCNHIYESDNCNKIRFG